MRCVGYGQKRGDHSPSQVGNFRNGKKNKNGATDTGRGMTRYKDDLEAGEGEV